MMVTVTFGVQPHLVRRIAYKLGRMDPTASFVEVEQWIRSTVNDALEQLPTEPQTVAKTVRIKKRTASTPKSGPENPTDSSGQR